ncbi:MAG: U32 family peptidase [Agathobacter sp.]|nr:U32 family peptidase [Agathobacter sp.]
MMKQEFELLAPAGSFEILKAVIAAGADAVYVGGSQFGARAYANNFTEEELLEAIDYVHLRGKKLFLTVNTLFKNHEINDALYDYLLPYYNRGLDAVIVQDFGVIDYIMKHFPDLPIHTSTQMTITGVEGAKLLKDLGVERVVLARELSIAEMKKIRKEADVELEAFIHGALCYSFSGQCLFSSMLGGRSGNRGRCAQPCRLPYAVLDEQKKEYKKESYVLSLKDLCGIEYLQQLREAGVYSLKIEGRMKQASYAAGVVSYYRKYIDLEKQVSKEDMLHLYELGNRCGFTSEYFVKHNDKSMITFEKPSYEKSNEALHQEIERKFVGQKSQIPVTGTLMIYKGQALEFYVNSQEHHAYVSLGEVQEAKNKPLTEEDVRERMNKTGETSFYFENLEIQMDGDVFVPNGVLNQLRREALAQLEEQMLASFVREEVYNESEEMKDASCQTQNKVSEDAIQERIICSCETREQLETILDKGDFVTTIYVDSHIYDRDAMVEELEADITKAHNAGKEIYLKLPAIFRMQTSVFYNKIKSRINNMRFDGVVVRNYEELHFAKEVFPQKKVVIDHSLYTYNDYAKHAFAQYEIHRDTIPLELNQKEIRRRDNRNSEMVIYGHYPLMTTAGCVHKNTASCDKKSGITYLKDRYNVLFPVKNYCKDCYNIVYNSVPVLLFGEINRLKEYGIRNFRLDFTIESGKEVDNILNLYSGGKGCSIEYTNGHYKRGVE